MSIESGDTGPQQHKCVLAFCLLHLCVEILTMFIFLLLCKINSIYHNILPSSAPVPAKLVFDPSSCLAGCPSARNSSELAGNQHNLLCNIGSSTQVELKTFFQNFEKMEDDLQERQPPGKTTLIEDEVVL